MWVDVKQDWSGAQCLKSLHFTDESLEEDWRSTGSNLLELQCDVSTVSGDAGVGRNQHSCPPEASSLTSLIIVLSARMLVRVLGFRKHRQKKRHGLLFSFQRLSLFLSSTNEVLLCLAHL